jgi:uncharacterized membrane protein
MNQEIERAPGELVDVAGLVKQSWGLFAQKPLEHVLGSLIVALGGTLTLGVLMGPLAVGQIRMIDKQRRGEDIRVEDVFSGFSSFAPAFVASLVFVVGVAIGLVLLVVPGVVLALGWAFALWFVALQRASATEALADSWALLKAHPGSVLLVLLVVTLLNLLGGAVLLATLLTAPLSFIFATLAFHELEDDVLSDP